jgi:hypothetical protein
MTLTFRNQQDSCVNKVPKWLARSSWSSCRCHVSVVHVITDSTSYTEHAGLEKAAREV